MPNLEYELLEDWVTRIFTAAGMSNAFARRTAAALVQTDAEGVGSHGVMRVPIYATRLASGSVNSRPVMLHLAGDRAFEAWDGDNGLGIEVGLRATDRVAELAKHHGIGMVTVRNSNHFGAAAIYTKLLASQGLLGLVGTNVKPFLVAPGAAVPTVGNNPMSFAAGDGEASIVLDMAMSVAAAGKISAAIKAGEPIPEGWATDRHGRPTADGAAAFEGFLQPMAGHKGAGLAYMVEVLAGVLSGGRFSSEVLSMYEAPDQASGTSHWFIAIDPGHTIGRDRFEQRVSDFMDEVHSTPSLDPHRRVQLPGEPERARTAHARTRGIDLNNRVIEELIEISAALGVELPPFPNDQPSSHSEQKEGRGT